MGNVFCCGNDFGAHTAPATFEQFIEQYGLSEIEPGEKGLYLGPEVVMGQDRACSLLPAHGFTSVVTVMKRADDRVGAMVRRARAAGLDLLHIPIFDEGTEPLSSHFIAAHDFLKRREGKVLVHCSAGVSRSATVVTAHTMMLHGCSAEEAFSRVKALRPWVQPNAGFIRQLIAFEAEAAVPSSGKWLAAYVHEVYMGGDRATAAGISVAVMESAMAGRKAPSATKNLLENTTGVFRPAAPSLPGRQPATF